MKSLTFCKISFLFIIICLLCGFTTPLYDNPVKDSNLPKGDPDPNKGIYLRYNSTAEDILAESSSSVRLGVSRLSRTKDGKTDINGGKIFNVKTLLTDRTPKKLILLDSMNTTIIDSIYAPSISLASKETINWAECRFRLFAPATFQEAEILEARLANFENTLRTAGWTKDISPEWNNYKLPQSDIESGGYGLYTSNEFTLVIWVKMRNPRFNDSKNKLEQYYAVISLRNKGANLRNRNNSLEKS